MQEDIINYLTKLFFLPKENGNSSHRLKTDGFPCRNIYEDNEPI